MIYGLKGEMRNTAGLYHVTAVSLRGVGEFAHEMGATPTEMIWEVVYLYEVSLILHI